MALRNNNKEMATPDYFARKPSYQRTRTGGLLTPGGSTAATAVGGASPRTPTLGRAVSGQYNSPGGYRSEEEFIIYTVGTRSLSVGFAGEPDPRYTHYFGPEESRRADDFRNWIPGASTSLYRQSGPWAKDWELWTPDIRGLDMELIADKIDRAIRDANTKYLMLDQRSRRAILALPTGISSPLLYLVLNTFFKSSAPSSIQIWSNPLLSTVSAGLRSALVVDIGWRESTVTSVYEYREVLTRRTNRATKLLSRRTARMLEEHTGPRGSREKVSFETAEAVMQRAVWCKKAKSLEDEDQHSTTVQLPIKTVSGLSTTLRIPFDELAEPVEHAFLDHESRKADDENLPLHVLAYRCLLALPLDVRAICMSRIIITGGASHIPGLKPRLLREIEALVKQKGWDPVMNYGSAAEARRNAVRSQSSTLQIRAKPPDEAQGQSSPIPTRDTHDKDEISDKLAREAAKRGQAVQGTVRGVETLGAWAGASLVSTLKLDSMLEVKREDFLKYGLACLGSRLNAI